MSLQNRIERLSFIDSARGIAALMVLLQHGLEASGLTNAHTGFGHNLINLGQAGVVTFFLISGFVIPLGVEKWGSLKQFAISRIARIYPLYVFILLINILLLNSANFLQLDIAAQIKLVTAHLLFIQEYTIKKNCVAASWTLAVEMVWYIIFAVTVALGVNKRHRAITYPLIAILVALATLSIIKGIRIPLGRIDLLLLCTAGLLMYRKFTNSVQLPQFIEVLSFIFIAIAFGQWVAFGHHQHPEITFNAITSSWLLGIVVFYGFYASRKSKHSQHPILLKLGTYSYSIYLVHPLIIQLIEQTSIKGVPMLIALIGTTVLASLFTYKYIEQPAIQWAANLRRKSILPAN